jgi:DNA-binding CsgD family transcriptional regulator
VKRQATRLTPRERDVVAAILDGCTTDKELAERLGISLATVQTHLVNIYRKIGVHSRTEMVIQEMRLQWQREESGGESN